MTFDSGRGFVVLCGGTFDMSTIVPGGKPAASVLGNVVQELDANKRLAKIGLKRMFLHAASLEFKHPRSEQTVRIEARIIGRLGSLVQAQATAFVSGAKVLSAELTFSGSTADNQSSLSTTD